LPAQKTNQNRRAADGCEAKKSPADKNCQKQQPRRATEPKPRLNRKNFRECDSQSQQNCEYDGWPALKKLRQAAGWLPNLLHV
jgi:hypothetical protein